jgi:hypothetical protein
MTKKELTFNRKSDLRFSQWIRQKLPDSYSGFVVSDIDFILSNYQTKKILLLEIKANNNAVPDWQTVLFKKINKWLKTGIDKDWQYLGFHLIKFEKQFFEGKVFFDNREISENELIKILSF